MKRALFYFALAGWLLGILVNVLSLLDIDVTEKAPFIWLLHIGIFVVWIPAVLDLRENQELKDYMQSGILNQMNPIGFYKIIFKDIPTWIILLALGGFFYAGINFILFISSQEGTASIKDGQFVLQNHGQLVRILTKQEYHHYSANEVRGISGHWILFYGMATGILFKYSGLTKKNN
jgi:hypothetical protein